MARVNNMMISYLILLCAAQHDPYHPDMYKVDDRAKYNPDLSP